MGVIVIALRRFRSAHTTSWTFLRLVNRLAAVTIARLAVCLALNRPR
ncbi:hypothetical protein jaqu_35120 [Jannaschia aquimarina]|uniref:Uncharacterized protein n=2 Tax=Jannaschia aquimarina TaxID=935700 RepID=A0A0D1EAP5_9RHOB|nr:hypothetical protein jaqu_35120 [Jannaschia aquimarina]SNT42443.1 hypothetical protein SAMN05421775_1194 [Jannaschia aquimarina]